MIKPTQDKELRQFIYFRLLDLTEIEGTKIEDILNQILNELEKRDYHVGLPPSIEEALNSGDGSYRP